MIARTCMSDRESRALARLGLIDWLRQAAAVVFILGIASFAPVTAHAVEVRYQTVNVDGTDVFYREAGPKNAPVILLLHGFPTSSHMFRNLIPALADKYHVIAPDYPGYGHSSAPTRGTFSYTFERYFEVVDQLTDKLGLSKYALYVMDYGAPVGFRLAARYPDRVSALIIQNGNAYDEGLSPFWDPIKAYWKENSVEKREAIRWLTTIKATKWQYTEGFKDPSRVSPDAWTLDQALMDRPENAEIQLDLFYDYRTNPPLYPAWQEYFRNKKPATLIVGGKNDQIFPAAGAEAFKRDLPNAEFHLLDTGHFALESHGDEIAQLIRGFLDRAVTQ